MSATMFSLGYQATTSAHSVRDEAADTPMRADDLAPPLLAAVEDEQVAVNQLPVGVAVEVLAAEERDLAVFLCAQYSE